MAGWNPYGAGDKIYNGVSRSANQGMTLDPSGYVQRELSKPSDARSGLAAGALQALRTPSSSIDQPIDYGGPAAPAPVKQVRLGPHQAAKPTKYSGNVTTPKYTQVRATNLGSIKFVKDQDLNADITNATRAYYDAKNSNLGRAQEVQNQFNIDEALLQQQTSRGLLDLLNTFGGNGMAFSSGQTYYDSQARTDADNQLKQLQATATEKLAEITRAQTEASSALAAARESARGEQKYRNTTRAKGWTR